MTTITTTQASAHDITAAPLQSWQKVWRDGFAPQLSDAALEALAAGLERDDLRILQGRTVSPPPVMAELPVEGACAVGFACWQGDGLAKVIDLESKFVEVCREADRLLGEFGASRYFLNAWDETPRNIMLPAMLAEVRREQARRSDYRAELAADDRAADECAAMAESMPGQFGTTDAF